MPSEGFRASPNAHIGTNRWVNMEDLHLIFFITNSYISLLYIRVLMPLICDVKTSSKQSKSVHPAHISVINPQRTSQKTQSQWSAVRAQGFSWTQNFFVPQRKVNSAKIIENKKHFKPPLNVEWAENVLIFHLAYIAPALTVRSPIMLMVICSQPPKGPFWARKNPGGGTAVWFKAV